MKCRSYFIKHLSGSLRPHPRGTKLTAQTPVIGSPRIGRTPIPAGPPSSSQQSWRDRYAACVTEWNGLSDEEKESYRPAADSRNISPYNQFMSECLLYTGPTLYERFTPLPNHCQPVYASWYYCQQFTVGSTGPNEDHNITSVEMRLYNYEGFGIVPIWISAVNELGEPTGPPLSTGEVLAQQLPLWPNHIWTRIDMTPYVLQASTMYTLVISFVSGSETSFVCWGYRDRDPLYPGGMWGFSWDLGISWGWYPHRDFCFKVFGEKV